MKTGKILVFVWLTLAGLTYSCGPAPQQPMLVFQSPRILVKNLIANNLIVPRFAPGGREIIFNGRLDGDLWDCIYQIPVIGGLPQKIYGANDDLLYPSYSPDERQVVFSQGFSRQIHLLDIVTKKVTALPIFGNYPTFLPDGNSILYAGVLHANLRLYNLNDGRQRTLTTSYLTVNFCPLITPDRGRIVWLENRPQEQVRVNRTDFDALKTKVLRIFREPLLSWTLSPSGEWAIASRPDGEPFGFTPDDTIQATIAIRLDTLVAGEKLLAYSVDWSPTGQQITYLGNSVPQFSRENPFMRQGIYRGDLTVSALKWENIADAEILQSPPAVSRLAFPTPEQTARNTAEPFVPAEVNSPPKIVSDPVETIRQGELYLYRIQAVEINLFDKLNYILVDGPANAELLSRTGVLVWLPADTGRFEFTVAVEDDHTGLDSQTFSVTVLPDNKWNQTSFEPPPVKVKASDFSAGIRFIDPNNDGFLTPGEEAVLQIDLKPLKGEPLDSLRLQLLFSTNVGEIAADELIVFRNCQPGRWNRMSAAIKGLPELRNRRILIRGILETKYGIQMLPANLIINGKNPDREE